MPRAFVPVVPKPLPPDTSLRVYHSADRECCLAIYSENEPGHFPPGFSDVFEQTLDRPDYLKLVLNVQGRLAAVGAIGLFPRMIGLQNVWLAFGMVRPDVHGQGLGTALLLARLAALPEPKLPMKVLLSNVARSESFLERFGFEYQGQMPGLAGGPMLDVRAALLDRGSWQRCREIVGGLGFAPQEIPATQVVDFWAVPPPVRQSGPPS